MSLRRKILLALLIIPVAMIVLSIIWPGTATELAFLVLGVPVLVLNVWEFYSTEASGPFGGGSKESALRPAGKQEGPFLKYKSILTIALSFLVLIIIVVVYALIRVYVDRVPFLYALSIFLIKLGSKLWHFLTNPAIFISLFGLLLLWLLRKQIIKVIKETRGSDQVKFPDSFHRFALDPVPDDTSEENKPEPGKPNEPETAPLMEWLIREGLDLKTIQLLLEMDGIDINKPYLLFKMDALGINSKGLPEGANKGQKEAFYSGVLDELYAHVFPVFCSIEMKNDAKVARFTLRAGIREKLFERLNRIESPPESIDI